MKEIPPKFLETVEYQFRFFRRTDSLRLAECQYQSYLLYFGSRPAQPKLFLDTSSADGHYRATPYRYV